ncbi:MAG TPA: D-glycero-beta-D-manno-heptose-7-phosphate kinase, partial [Anaerolineales bacterium]|nr:D-glycero-beta-D-manno-heptose-7-phosphate kinase [Anaerolineales bacterium]
MLSLECFEDLLHEVGEAQWAPLQAQPPSCFHLPASNRTQVFDVTGAGDTLIAVTTLALAAGL